MKTLIITQLYNVQQYEHTKSIAFWRCVVELYSTKKETQHVKKYNLL